MADIQKSEATLVKKVWDIANVLASAGVGFTDYITQLTYILFLKMDAEKEELGLGSSIPEGYKWKDIAELNGDDLIDKYEDVLKELSKDVYNQRLIPFDIKKVAQTPKIVAFEGKNASRKPLFSFYEVMMSGCWVHQCTRQIRGGCICTQAK